jgi:hypothetical protein
MTDETRKIYESAAGFENAADDKNEAERVARYIATHVACRAGHHRPLNPEKPYNDPCPVCGSLVPHRIDASEVPKSLR